MATRVLYRALADRGYSFFQRTKVTAEKSLVLPIVVDFSTYVTKFVRRIKDNLNKGIQQFQTFSEYITIIAFRRRKNLQDYLVTAQVKPLSKFQSRAKTKISFQHRKWLKNPQSKKMYKITTENEPSIQNCVYLIQCTT